MNNSNLPKTKQANRISVPTALILGCCATLLFPTHKQAAAQVLVANPTQTAQDILHQVETMAHRTRAIQQEIEQLQQAAETHGALTGTRLIGDLMNGSYEKDLRRALPDDLNSILSLNTSGTLSGAVSRTKAAYDSLFQSYAPLSGAEYTPLDPTSDFAKAQDHTTNATFAAMAASESTYNVASERVAQYEDMIDNINSSQDLKHSTDLSARIAAENGMVMNELLKAQSLQTRLMAAQQGGALTDLKNMHEANKYNPSKAAAIFSIDE